MTKGKAFTDREIEDVMSDVWAPILGYTEDGQPIYPTKRGYIYTAAVICCRECGAIIRGLGGPQFGSICLKCHDKEAANGIGEKK